MKFMHPGGFRQTLICTFTLGCLLSHPLNAEPLIVTIPEPKQVQEQEPTQEQRVEQGKQNLEAIKDAIRGFTRTQLTDNTDMVLEYDALKIRSRFHNGAIKTELEAEKNGDLTFRLKIPF